MYTYLCEHCGFYCIDALNAYLAHQCDPGARALFKYQTAVFCYGRREVSNAM